MNPKIIKIKPSLPYYLWNLWAIVASALVVLGKAIELDFIAALLKF